MHFVTNFLETYLIAYSLFPPFLFGLNFLIIQCVQLNVRELFHFKLNSMFYSLSPSIFQLNQY